MTLPHRGEGARPVPSFGGGGCPYYIEGVLLLRTSDFGTELRTPACGLTADFGLRITCGLRIRNGLSSIGSLRSHWRGCGRRSASEASGSGRSPQVIRSPKPAISPQAGVRSSLTSPKSAAKIGQNKAAGIRARRFIVPRGHGFGRKSLRSGHLGFRLCHRLRGGSPDVSRHHRTLLGPIPPGNDQSERLLLLDYFTDFFHSALTF